MIWADRVSAKLKEQTQHVDDMKTPSGYIHMGSLRGPLLHDVMYKVLKKNDKKTVFTYIFNDFDPIDGLSDDLKKDFAKYLGFPLRLTPSPDGKARSFADFFIDDFKKVLSDLGCEATYLSSYDMYHEGKFNELIKIALDNGEKIQDIYQRISGSRKKEINWFPFQVVCPECGKLGTTKVTAWDGKEVTFTCEKSLVVWAVGCGYRGKMSPFDGKGKLPWKVDWPAHWKVLGVTFEGAGKDHASKGGSYDIAFALCEEVFKYPKPYYFPYEHFLLGGRKMSSSKGVGLRAHDLTSILPPELGRFLMVRTIPNRALEFDPYNNTIPDLFDEFDRCAKAFWDKGDSDLARIFELSMVNNFYNQKIFLPRFKDIVLYLQSHNLDLNKRFAETKREVLTDLENQILKQRVIYAKKWLESFAPKEETTTILKEMPEVAKNLSPKQKDFLNRLATILENEKSAEVLQTKLFDLAKSCGLTGKEAFSAIYLATIGRTFGPKAAWFLLSLDKGEIIKRFKEIK